MPEEERRAAEEATAQTEAAAFAAMPAHTRAAALAALSTDGASGSSRNVTYNENCCQSVCSNLLSFFSYFCCCKVEAKMSYADSVQMQLTHPKATVQKSALEATK